MSFRFAIVDDAAFIRELLKNHLTALGGLCVGEAEDGKVALHLVESTLPDVLILDMVMPGMNAIQLLPSVKQACPEMKVMVCSSLKEDDLTEQAMGAGADAYVHKPFERSDLQKVLKNFGFISKEAAR